MTLFDCHIAIQASLYFCIMVAGIIAVISIVLNQENFEGSCILFGGLNDFNQLELGNDSLCSYTIYVGVLAWIIYGLSSGCYYARAAYLSHTYPGIGSRMWVKPLIILNTILGFMSFATACILSAGFSKFCNSIKSNVWTPKDASCQVKENDTWFLPYHPHNTFNAGPYFKLMATAQIAAWTCVLLYIIQLALCLLRFYRNKNLVPSNNNQSTDSGKIDVNDA